MNERLESNEFFEEMVLITPFQYEKFKQWREQETIDPVHQSGSGFVESEAMESGRKRYRGQTNITDDVNPVMAKKKKTYLMATNNVEAIVQFNKVLALQRNLDEHFNEGKQLLAGYTIATLSKEIARLKKKYGAEFDEILRGSSSRSKQPAVQTPPTLPVSPGDTEDEDEMEDELEGDILEDSEGELSEEEEIWKKDLKDWDIDWTTTPTTSWADTFTPQGKTIKNKKKGKGKKKLFSEQKGSGFSLLFKNDKHWDNV